MQRLDVLFPVFECRTEGYREVELRAPDLERWLTPYLPTGWSADSVLDALGLVGGCVQVSRDTPVPLALEQSKDGTRQVVAVRTSGRGCVIPNAFLKVGSDEWAGHIVVKGSGIAAWVQDNLDWVRSETNRQAVTLGQMDVRAMALDLSGEALCRSSGVVAPRIVSVASLAGSYQIARLWRCPYRLWELTVGPQRLGPGVSQAFVETIWPVELFFSLRYREVLSRRAARQMELADSSVELMMKLMIESLTKCAIGDLQILPHAFHLANSSYSGETSGFDRIRSRDAFWFKHGLMCALVDIWVNCSLVSCVLSGRSISFNSVKLQWLAQMEAVGGSDWLIELCREPISDDFDTGADLPLTRPFHHYYFLRKCAGNAERYLSAVARHFEALARIFSGQIDSYSQLDNWLAEFPPDHEARVTQAFGGYIEGDRRDAYAQSLRRSKQLAMDYREILLRRKPGEPLHQ